MGNNTGFPPAGNSTLEEVEMSQITVKKNTSLYVPVGASSEGVFKGCRALKKVTMPLAAQCANITNLRGVFWNCSALEAIDLAGCSQVTSLQLTFSNASALKKVDNLKDCTSVKDTTSAFDKCIALE